jgi:Alw26I/Eco31I/Esp3I family type II restriction endonuclease
MPARKNYGSRGQQWHPDFVAYMNFIANHPSYAGMPDAFVDEGKIQWEAPSNRGTGRFKDTHHRRRDWWRAKARGMGISTESEQWISRCAKRLHPTGRKPCKRCGRVLELRYTYPGKILLGRVVKLRCLPAGFTLETLETISDLVRRLHTACGNELLAHLPALFRAKGLSVPESFASVERCIEWLERDYIPAEPSLLSPGAMSNAPDRFDGFHSFNLCCRGAADTGRHQSSLARYVTDRRVFEYWADGDWIAADRLMGIVRAEFRASACLNGHAGPCDADHIGPISLGFTHRPEFQMLCKACNSAKNNRMTLADVEHLRRLEATGTEIISWHSSALWNLRKGSVVDDESALRLSKLLRDNRHTFMAALQQVEQAGRFAFLLFLLNLHFADFDVEFAELSVAAHLTRFAEMKTTRRTTKYAAEQKARRCRIALRALHDYFAKANRSAHVVSTAAIEGKVKQALDLLGAQPETFQRLDTETARLLRRTSDDALESGLRRLVKKLPANWPVEFLRAKAFLGEAMALTAAELARRWDNERYVRAEFASD